MEIKTTTIKTTLFDYDNAHDLRGLFQYEVYALIGEKYKHLFVYESYKDSKAYHGEIFEQMLDDVYCIGESFEANVRDVEEINHPLICFQHLLEYGAINFDISQEEFEYEVDTAWKICTQLYGDVGENESWFENN